MGRSSFSSSLFGGEGDGEIVLHSPISLENGEYLYIVPHQPYSHWPRLPRPSVLDVVFVAPAVMAVAESLNIT